MTSYSRVPLDKEEKMTDLEKLDFHHHRYPFCVVWTPIPLLSWLIPFIGHTGIATSSGVIRDFAGPYYVSEDDMAFGNPTKYWQLDSQSIIGGASAWDAAVLEASDVYSHRIHKIICDNCHSHVAYALNTMGYKGSTSWNMVYVCWNLMLRGSFVGCRGFFKTYLMPLVVWSIIIAAIFYSV
ncbi:transmembrane protein 222 isoform X1 [Lepeophtheirus salmonis]|uniref:C1orf160 n=2 Tax=Lepeophtheirus salmonis TaxID=72036 RepID=C1BSW3_LEPSM|nr:transmembrane protein 222-like isoform X1 [Lepeophtheirus salmonis]XP_040574616.1 transmembrane protein 222-like isoform X1 [Lepeophtheirus salmonis]ACO12116.1 C1orf160 [Lepeophtheirus salmonis]ADD38925.1 Transmembrane protein 222 [Lepeophtheirus salmonis]